MQRAGRSPAGPTSRLSFSVDPDVRIAAWLARAVRLRSPHIDGPRTFPARLDHVASIIAAGATVVAAWMAVKGINDWRRQLRETARYRVAEGLQGSGDSPS